MFSVILNSALGVLFTVIAALSFCGKSTNLIAGYNNADEEEKAKYDNKKLEKGLGISTAIIALFEYLFAFLSYRAFCGAISDTAMKIFIAVYAVAVICIIAAFTAYANTKCKTK